MGCHFPVGEGQWLMTGNRNFPGPCVICCSRWHLTGTGSRHLSVPVHHGRQEVQRHDSAALLPPNRYCRKINFILAFHRSQITAVMVWWCNDVMTHLSEHLKLIQLISPSSSAWAWMFWCSRCSEHTAALPPSQKVKSLQNAVEKVSHVNAHQRENHLEHSCQDQVDWVDQGDLCPRVSRFFCWFHEYLLMNVMFSSSG